MPRRSVNGRFELNRLVGVLVLFEWKCCETYLHPENKGTGGSGQTRRSKYLEQYHAPTSSFIGDVPFNEFLYDLFYRSMRLRLLAHF